MGELFSIPRRADPPLARIAENRVVVGISGIGFMQ
jgi:hypothetical protein